MVLPDGSGAHVPPDGRTVGADVLTTGGGEHLTITNDGGRVQAEYALPGDTGVSDRDRSVAASPPACSDGAYNYEGFTVPGGRFIWRYNSGTAARRGLPASSTLTAIRAAINDLTKGRNDCGLNAGAGFGALGEYYGDTNGYANVNSNGQCTDTPDSANIVSWGPLPARILAVTCYRTSIIGTFSQADIYIRSNRDATPLTLGIPANCTIYDDPPRNFHDLESVVTHEWGHAFGLAHVSENDHKNLTMSELDPICSYSQRTLGLGDFNGMAAKYGYQ